MKTISFLQEKYGPLTVSFYQNGKNGEEPAAYKNQDNKRKYNIEGSIEKNIGKKIQRKNFSSLNISRSIVFSQELNVKSRIAEGFIERFQLKPEELNALRTTRDGFLHPVRRQTKNKCRNEKCSIFT